MRNILDGGVWDSNMQERLRPFVTILSPTLVARVLNQVVSVETAKYFFDWVAEHDGYKHDVYVFNALILKLGLVKNFNAIWELVKRMQTEKCTPTSTTFATIIHYYGKACLLEECWKTPERAKYFGVKPDARIYTALLQVLFNAGKVVKAKQLFHRMEDRKIEFDIHTWFTMIQGLCKNKMLADAHKYWDRMLSSGCKPNAHVYNAIILGYYGAGYPLNALSYFDLMQKQGCKPDIYTYNTLIQCYCGLQMFAEAEGLLSEMQNAGCEPNQVTFNILLQHLSQKGETMEADSFFSRMQAEGWVDHVSYRIYLSRLRRLGEINKLISLAENLYSRYGTSDVEVCNAILQFYCEKGDLLRATNYLDEAFVRFSAPNEFSFALMINAFCKSGDVDAARSLLSKMVETGCVVTTMHYDPVIVTLCKHARGSEALQLFKEMNVKDVKTSSFACEHLLEALSDAGLVEAAILLCKHIILKRHPVKGLPLVSFMKCLRGLNRLEESKVLLKAMMHAGCLPHSRNFKCCLAYLLQGEIAEVEKSFSKQLPNLVDYTMRIQVACRNGSLDVAKAVLSEMKESGFAPTSACYNKLVFRLSKFKDTAVESLELFEEMLERGLAPADALPSYLMDCFSICEQQEVILRLCRLIIAKRLTLRNGSASFLLRQEDESELKKLHFELKESGCLVENVPTYSTQELKLNEEFSESHDSLLYVE